jgi:hypothetical protein
MRRSVATYSSPCQRVQRRGLESVMSFTHLFTPTKIGSLEIRDERLIAYHEARAKRGAGLLIVEIAHSRNGFHWLSYHSGLRDE